ncbi:YkgJ family cysteine cluster protein [Oceanobacillus jeddahense]|uniref:YkgJ family cysteine cluster protein n=1 Tax=Oceanobacillus jeddahense TaxID=1462527 RepID=A0ABY5JQP4_9BACI|nr:YkgJ family cysteine cluster protein [Oceanobacillus jeddahense]UUI00939.1 YkgJ family cysteine cluster protein [Oceanobacillus jeddahense]
MTAFLTYEEIMLKCEEINKKYEINQERFDEVIDCILYEEEMSADDKIAKAFVQLLQAVSEEINDMESTANLTPTCQMGCAFCCYFPIVINKMEAKLIKDAISKMPGDRKHFIEDHLIQYNEMYSAKIERLGNLDLASDPDAKYKYRKEHLPCPFLNLETNACMIYEVRPIPCRTYVNYTNPAVCSDNVMPKETISYEFLYQEYMSAMNELLQYLFENGKIEKIDYPGDLYQDDLLINWVREAVQ